ncbi:MAG: hypothetical protein ACLSFB_11225 [[Clostridium] scindens]
MGGRHQHQEPPGGGEYYADTYITLMNGSQMCVQTKKFSVKSTRRCRRR